jgi:hypothetical protein
MEHAVGATARNMQWGHLAGHTIRAKPGDTQLETQWGTQQTYSGAPVEPEWGTCGTHNRHTVGGTQWSTVEHTAEHTARAHNQSTQQSTQQSTVPFGRAHSRQEVS